MHTYVVWLVILAGLVAYGTSFAAGSGPPSAYPSFAEVVSSKPIYTRETVYTPVKRCTWETLPALEHYSRNGYERRVTERRARRCRYVNRPSVRRQITAYEVTLRYQGTEFTRITATRPGKRMPITVEINTLH
ncbi:MAG: hypothetical protein ACFHXK_17435 [bacterium]